MLIILTDDKCLDKSILCLYNTYITNIKNYVDWTFLRIYLYAPTFKLLVLIMEKTKKMGDGVCCPVGEECPPEPPKPEDITGSVKQYVNPYAIPYVQSDHLKNLIKKKEALDQKQRPPKL
tara:strand:+ start:16662 stop:17021 length:360 start_codon:yes stop_codon:yes gene_type:complete